MLKPLSNINLCLSSNINSNMYKEKWTKLRRGIFVERNKQTKILELYRKFKTRQQMKENFN